VLRPSIDGPLIHTYFHHPEYSVTRHSRHSCAVSLLEAGVDVNVIRGWLGHVSLNTTNIYAEVDMEMKAKALATCEVRTVQPQKHWREDTGLIEFLRSL
jgi:integrase/recombinase XerD